MFFFVSCHLQNDHHNRKNVKVLRFVRSFLPFYPITHEGNYNYKYLTDRTWLSEIKVKLNSFFENRCKSQPLALQEIGCQMDIGVGTNRLQKFHTTKFTIHPSIPKLRFSAKSIKTWREWIQHAWFCKTELWTRQPFIEIKGHTRHTLIFCRGLNSVTNVAEGATDTKLTLLTVGILL